MEFLPSHQPACPDPPPYRAAQPQSASRVRLIQASTAYPLIPWRNMSTTIEGNGDQVSIGVIGAGSLGETLGRQLARLGYVVSISNSRGPESLAALAAEIGAKPVSATEANGLALGRFSVIYATPPCVITRRSPAQGSRTVPEHLCLTRPYVPKARTLRFSQQVLLDHLVLE